MIRERERAVVVGLAIGQAVVFVGVGVGAFMYEKSHAVVNILRDPFALTNHAHARAGAEHLVSDYGVAGLDCDL